MVHPDSINVYRNFFDDREPDGEIAASWISAKLHEGKGGRLEKGVRAFFEGG